MISKKGIAGVQTFVQVKAFNNFSSVQQIISFPQIVLSLRPKTLLFQRSNNTKMIVFTSTQDGVEFLYRLVRFLSREENQSDSDVEEEEQEVERTSLDVYRLHGDMSQKVDNS